MEYKILEEKTVFDDHYKIIEAKVTYETFENKEITTRRLAFERGDSAAILLVNTNLQNLLLINQFRYPTCKHDEGWLLEIPAGSVEENEDPADCIEREVMEELGYKINSPKLIHTFYTSPGAATERIFLFYAEVSPKDKIAQGGGNDGGNEDIQSIEIPIPEIKDRLSEIKDAKTLVALQWFLIGM